MQPVVKRLTDLSRDCNIPWAELRKTQVEAANERFQGRRQTIKLLDNRARQGGVDAISDLSSIVPLLFAHTTYKSYPERWLSEGDWTRLNTWLEAVVGRPVDGVDVSNVNDIDDWIERLQGAGHYLSCSSGTTGKAAILDSSAPDMVWSRRDTVDSFAWGSGVKPRQDRRVFSVVPPTMTPRNTATRGALKGAYGDPNAELFSYPVPPITVGQVTGMVALRKRIADGTAKPGEVANFERISAARLNAVTAAVGFTAEALVAARAEKLLIVGRWASLYEVAEAVRAMGFSGKDFHPDNTGYIGGGLKGALLPPTYREYIFETFNISPGRFLEMYGMQELNSAMPRCLVGRYHVPPWVICLLLDEGGDKLLPIVDGENEGRAGFFDLSLDGRWGGVITGDKIQVDYGRCACGNEGPTIRDNITRYADLPGGDKITCAGTIDAYVRGVA